MKEEKGSEMGNEGRAGAVKRSHGGVGGTYLTSVMVAIASHDKKTFIPCTRTLMDAVQAFMLNNIKFIFQFEVGLPYVGMARNNLEYKFMLSECEHLVFIDADVGISPQDLISLVLAKEDVVSLVYPKKSDEEQYTVMLEIDNGKHPVEKNGGFKAEGAPTGAMKIRRHVLEKMRERYEATHGYDDPLEGTKRYNLFGSFLDNRRWYGDDYGFCKLWRDMGGEVLVLPNTTLTHTGTKTWQGNLYEHLVKRSSSPVVRALAVDGWMSQTELEWLYGRAALMNEVAEVGAFKGRTTTALAEACRGMVYAIDHWEGDDDGNKVLRGIYDKENVEAVFDENMKPYANVVKIRKPSVEATKVVKGEVDMVFIDGEHTYESVKADIEAWLPITRRLLCGHDYSNEWPGVVRAVTEAFGSVNVVGSIWWVDLDICSSRVEVDNGK